MKSSSTRPKQRDKLLAKKRDQMRKLHEKEIDLKTYMKSIGHMVMTSDQRLLTIVHDLTFDATNIVTPDDIISDSDINEITNDNSTNVHNTLKGNELRQERMKNNSLNFDDISSAPKVRQDIPKNLTLKKGLIYARQRLKKIGYAFSTGTKADGWCLIHAILDQLKKDSEFSHFDFTPEEFREFIVDFLPDCIADGHIEWIDAEYGKVDHWMEKMRGNEWCDQNFIQLVSIYFNRKIIIFPVFPQNECDRNIIDPHDNCNCGEQVDESTTPFSLLYYEETHFVSAHYQSIRPKPNSQNTTTQKNPTQKTPNQSVIDPIVTSEIESTVQNHEPVSIDSLVNESQILPPQFQSSKICETEQSEIEIASFHSEFLDETESSPIIFRKPKTVKRKNPIIESDLDFDISNDSVATSSKAKPKSKVKKVAKSTETVDIDKSNIILGKRKRKF